MSSSVDITIKKNKIDAVASSIASYTRRDLIENEERRNMSWFCGAFSFVKRLRALDDDSEDDFVTTYLEKFFIEDMMFIIKKYIFEEIVELKNLLDDDEWLEEMASLYLQIEQVDREKIKPDSEKTLERYQAKKEIPTLPVTEIIEEAEDSDAEDMVIY